MPQKIFNPSFLVHKARQLVPFNTLPSVKIFVKVINTLLSVKIFVKCNVM